MEPRLYGNIIGRAPLWRLCDFGTRIYLLSY